MGGDSPILPIRRTEREFSKIPAGATVVGKEEATSMLELKPAADPGVASLVCSCANAISQQEWTGSATRGSEGCFDSSSQQDPVSSTGEQSSQDARKVAARVSLQMCQ